MLSKPSLPRSTKARARARVARSLAWANSTTTPQTSHSPCNAGAVHTSHVMAARCDAVDGPGHAAHHASHAHATAAHHAALEPYFVLFGLVEVGFGHGIGGKELRRRQWLVAE